MAELARAESRQPLQLCLLPDFELRRDDGSALPLTTRAQRLVVLLAINGRPLSRSAAAARLWPDVVNARANASLRATLWSLPRDEPSPVAIQANLLSLDTSTKIDLVQARTFATAVIDGTLALDGVRREDELAEDVLPDWPDDWLVIERERYRQLRLHALDALCVEHATAGRYARAVAAGLASVSSEPTRESAHRALMTAHLLEGNRMEAIRQYHTYLAMSRAEMGIGPSDLLQSLFRSALEDAPGDDAMTLR